MKVYAFKHSDESVLLKSSSGGAFSQIAIDILKEEGIVYGASFSDSWEVKHQRITNINELSRLRGSKYVFSDYRNTLTSVKEDLNNGHRVLYSGTPCQIAHLAKLIGSHKNLLLLEVVCHGSPESKYWNQYLKALCKKINSSIEDIESINFRDKFTGWSSYSFSIKFRDGKEFIEPYYKNLYMRAFLKNYTLRKPCFHCNLKVSKASKADLIIGDFWGFNSIFPNQTANDGVSLIIPNSDKGEETISNLRILKTAQLEQAAFYNPAILQCATPPTNYDKFLRQANRNVDIIKLFSKYAGEKNSARLKRFIKQIYNSLLRKN